MSTWKLLSVLIAPLTAVCCASASSLFDFEEFSVGSYSDLVEMDAGVSASFSQPGFNFSITNDGGMPATWGSRQLLPNTNTISPMIVTFSLTGTSVFIQTGDFGGDGDQVTLEAYSGPNATGSLVDSITLDYPASWSLPGNVLELALAPTVPFLSVRFWGRSDVSGTNSMYWDSLRFNATPEPNGAIVIFIGSSIGIWRFIRRHRADNRTECVCGVAPPGS